VIKATFNGASQVSLPDGTVIIGYTDQNLENLVLERRTASDRVWQTLPLAILRDPTKRHGPARSADFAATIWFDTVVVAGANQACVLEIGSGAERACFELMTTHQSSLDLLELRPLPKNRLLIVSTMRVWVVGQTCSVIARIDTDGILLEPPRVTETSIELTVFDESAEDERRIERMPLR
jgi:hypothetical protein